MDVGISISVLKGNEGVFVLLCFLIEKFLEEWHFILRDAYKEMSRPWLF
ncbi:hypothetical protein AMET1_0866 [Methanonatronarchaeum thermophilum]|uniref:Uncharacterized protein n=1 Tax=Methanonatronarchaeum thermophilum TaxID=1927129 RepID=A0A1Y3GFY6_9EURY|nr:hypothetical protein AMET1_0866 [Methanonatronarchaeum thermophilum]